MVAATAHAHHWSVEALARGGFFHGTCTGCDEQRAWPVDSGEWTQPVVWRDYQEKARRKDRRKLYSELFAALSDQWQTNRQLIAAGAPECQTWKLPALAREGLVERSPTPNGAVVSWRLASRGVMDESCN